MRILILGSGGREHALAWKFSKSNRISGLYIAPGNAGTAELGINISLDPLDFDAVLRVCRENEINYIFVGPEAPLAAGIVDALQNSGINIIGPHKQAALLESSKTFSKKFMQKYSLPTAGAKEFKNVKAFDKYIQSLEGKVVIKKNGLAAGKGVLESADREELLAFGHDILQNDTLIVEEFLEGYEISIFALYDGKNYLTLPPCSDFKKAGENDTGPNTGGMGSICPVPWVDKELLEQIQRQIIAPTFRGINKEKLNYKGVLYFGLMITENGPKILEYNVRFGDPETQVLLSVIKTDFGNLIEAVAEGTLESISEISNTHSGVCVVVAGAGYPGSYKKGLPVVPIKKYDQSLINIFHASTTTDSRGTVLTGGGRCFSVVGKGEDTLSAATVAYENMELINFEGAWFRSDIGKKFYIDKIEDME